MEEGDRALTAQSCVDASPYEQRQSLEQERAELPEQIAAALAALAATPLSHKARRERLMWQIRRAQKRLAEVERRLAGS